MDETDKKIRELTEAMRAEQDARIRNRMMAVRGILAGYHTKDAAYFADVDRRTVQLWVARFDEGGIGGLRDAPGRGRAFRARYGRIRKLADRLASKNMLTPGKLRNWIRGRLDARYSLCSVRRILRFLGFSPKRSATMYVSVTDADSVRQWQAGATGTISGAKRRGFTIVVQDESIFPRTGTNGRKLWPRVGGSSDCQQARQEGQDHRVRHACRGRSPADAAVWEVRRPDVCTIPQGEAPQVGQGPPRNGQRKPAQAQGGTEVSGGARRVGDPVPAYRDAEAQRSRVRMEGCKVQVCHFRTLRDVGGPDACGARIFQDVFNQA